MTSQADGLEQASLMRMARQGALALGLRGLGAGLAYALGIVIARRFGAEALGFYFTATAVVLFLSVLARCGWETAGLRLAAQAQATSQGPALRAWLHSILGRLIWTSVVAALAGFWVVRFWSDPGTQVAWAAALCATLGWSILVVVGEVFKGLGHLQRATFWTALAVPGLCLVLIWLGAGLFADKPAWAVGMIYALGVSLTAGLAGLTLWRLVYDLPGAPSGMITPDAGRPSPPLWIISILSQGVIPVIPFASFMVTDPGGQGAALFGAALRSAVVIAMIGHAVQALAMPQFARSIAACDYAGAERLGRRLTALSAGVAAPLTLTLCLAAPEVLGVFEPSFRSAAGVLVIVAVAQFLVVLIGPGGHLLLALGRDREVLIGAVLSALTVVVLCLGLVPKYGAWGAAVASGAGFLVNALWTAAMLRWRVGMTLCPLLPGRAPNAPCTAK